MRLVLLLGAGATVSDVSTRPVKHRPPLDRHFFAVSRTTHPTLVGDVLRYMRSVYGANVLEPERDSLEAVMGQIYTDLFNPALVPLPARRAHAGL